MESKFFSFGDRKYINNAVVLADSLEKIISIFGDVRDFRLQFKKPFFSQGNFTISPHKLDGHYTGHFSIDNTLLYFSYTPIDVKLEQRTLTVDDINQQVNIINLCYYIAENCHQVGLKSFEQHYGVRNKDDKSIVAIYEIPDTKIISEIIGDQKTPKLTISEPDLIADRRFKLSVSLNDKFFCNRYCSIKQFIL